MYAPAPPGAVSVVGLDCALGWLSAELGCFASPEVPVESEDEAHAPAVSAKTMVKHTIRAVVIGLVVAARRSAIREAYVCHCAINRQW
jgi:hypothetical protein